MKRKWESKDRTHTQEGENLPVGFTDWTASGKLLRGVKRLGRNLRVIDDVWRKHILGGEGSPKDVRTAAKGLHADYSQNEGRGTWGLGVKTLTTKTTYYKYDRDRRIIPLEHFNMLGHVPRPVLAGLCHSAQLKLSGDAQSMPTVTMLTSCLLLVAKLPGFWER